MEDIPEDLVLGQWKKGTKRVKIAALNDKHLITAALLFCQENSFQYSLLYLQRLVKVHVVIPYVNKVEES